MGGGGGGGGGCWCGLKSCFKGSFGPISIPFIVMFLVCCFRYALIIIASFYLVCFP